MCIISQIVSGLLLAAHYTPEVSQAFNSVVHTIRDVNGGWLIRSFHANGASFFFMSLLTCGSRNLLSLIFYGENLNSRL